MADDSYRKEYPQNSRPEDSQARPPPSQYPPPPQDNPQQRTAEAPPSSMAASVTLPSIHGGYPYNQGRPPYHDPRYASPTAVNGYPSPSQQQQQQQHPPPPPQQAQQQQPPPQQPPPGQQQQPPYLPPLQPQSDPRSPYPPPQEHRYYDDRRPYPHDPYAADYYGYRGQPPPPPPPGGHPPGGVYRDYRPNYPPGVYEYPPVGPPGAAPPLAQAAPRQRTSIACRYCRKRKIRCSGYQSAPGGKCQNCARMNQECIFQPVSSSSSTAFIPVSAVPGGVPPGTQLFGAYGQPLAPGTVPPHPSAPPQHGPPPPHGGPPHSAGPHPPAHHAPAHGGPSPYQQHPTSAPPSAGPAPYYGVPVQSPTGSYSSYGDAPRPTDDGQVTGRRRRRTSEEQEEGYRLPPPRPSTDDDPRRRSPAEFSNNSSSGGLPYNPYPGAKQSPISSAANVPPAGGNFPTRAPASRSPTGQNGSSGTSTPARSQQPQKGNSSVMSLSNLVTDIDKGMIERLNQSRDRVLPYPEQANQSQTPNKDTKPSQNGS